MAKLSAKGNGLELARWKGETYTYALFQSGKLLRKLNSGGTWKVAAKHMTERQMAYLMDPDRGGWK